MRLPIPSLLLPLLWSGAARALSCEEVMLMVDVGVPISIIVQTVQGATGLSACPTAPSAVQEAIANRPPDAPLPPEPLLPDPSAPGPDPAPPAPLPPEIAEAAQDPNARRAAIALHALASTHPDHAVALHTLLARRLLDLGLPHAAHTEAVTAVRAGPADPSYYDALTALIQTSAALGDSGDLAALIHTIPVDRYPAAVADELHYQRGLALYAADDLAAAKGAFAQVPTNSGRYWQAHYTIGVIYGTQGKLKSAVRAFRDVAKADPGARGGRPPPSDALRDLAWLGAASIYTSIERFDEAVKYTDRSPQSPVYGRAMLIRAWAQFMANQDPTPELDLLDGLDGVWAPEAGVLRTLWAFGRDEHAAATALATTWFATYDPVARAMSALQQHRPGEEGPAAARALYRTLADPHQQALPPGLVAALFRDAELRQAQDHLALLDREDRRLRRMPVAFRRALGDAQRVQLAADRPVLERRAGARLQALLSRLAHALADLRFQVQVLEFEAVDAQQQPGRLPGSTPDMRRSTPLLRQLVAAGGPRDAQSDLRLRLAARSDDAEAIALCEQVLDDDPQFHGTDRVLYQLALADPERTVALMGYLLANRPGSSERVGAWLVLGDDHFARGRLAQAQDAYTRAAAEPGHLHYGYALYKLGWVHYAQGDAVHGDRLLGLAAGVTMDPQLRRIAEQERARLAAP